MMFEAIALLLRLGGDRCFDLVVCVWGDGDTYAEAIAWFKILFFLYDNLSIENLIKQTRKL